MEKAIKRPIREVTLDDLLLLMDESVRQAIRDKATELKATHVVVFENVTLDSSQLGRRTAVMIGPDLTHKDIKQVEGKWLNDLPSQRQHPKCYAAVPIPKITE